MITSNIHEKKILQAPNMDISEWKDCAGTLYCPITRCEVSFRPYSHPLMNCLVAAVKKLIPRTKKVASTRNAAFLLYLQIHIITSYNSHIRTIKSRMIEVERRSDMSRNLWLLLKDLTEKVVKHNIIIMLI